MLGITAFSRYFSRTDQLPVNYFCAKKQNPLNLKHDQYHKAFKQQQAGQRLSSRIKISWVQKGLPDKADSKNIIIL